MLLLLLLVGLVLGMAVIDAAEEHPSRRLKRTSSASISATSRRLEDEEEFPLIMPEETSEDSNGAAVPPRDMADAEIAYKYETMATRLLTAVDDIAKDDVQDPTEFYMDNVAAMSKDDVIWDISAGPRQFSVNGTEAVGGLFDSFATRKFAFHQLSHFETFVVTTNVIVEFRYHGVVLEAEGNYLDIFGRVTEQFDTEDNKLFKVYVERFYTIDRGYTDS